MAIRDIMTINAICLLIEHRETIAGFAGLGRPADDAVLRRSIRAFVIGHHGSYDDENPQMAERLAAEPSLWARVPGYGSESPPVEYCTVIPDWDALLAVAKKIGAAERRG